MIVVTVTMYRTNVLSPGANPTIVGYDASVVKTNSTNL
jgi:hypothetical protein